jgi:hypothetical protein
VDVVHVAAAEQSRDDLDEVELPVVLVGVSDVEDLAAKLVGAGLERDDDGTGGVPRVDVRSPELLAEHLQHPARPQVSRELVHRKIESHARRDPVDGRETQAGGCHPGVAPDQQIPLDPDLLLGVERHGRQLTGLVNGDGRV